MALSKTTKNHEEIRKWAEATSHWVWGAMKMPGRDFHALHELWRRPERGDEYLGTLINAWLDQGGRAVGVPAGRQYVDAGTLDGYRAAMRLLEDAAAIGFEPEIEPVSNSVPDEKEANIASDFTTADRR